MDWKFVNTMTRASQRRPNGCFVPFIHGIAVERLLHAKRNRFAPSNTLPNHILWATLLFDRRKCVTASREGTSSRTQRHTAAVFKPRSLSSLPLLFPNTGTKNIWPTDPFALRQHTLDIVQLLLAFYIMFTIHLFHSTYNSFVYFTFISFRFSAFKMLAGRCYSMVRFNFALFGYEYCCFYFNLRVLRMDLNCFV